jgi:ornithine cyclodeaminase/alanine dehydrogenase-like protein (mu-crystallin family)
MLFLNGKEIMEAITPDQVMDAVSKAYTLFDTGTCYVPERAIYSYEGNKMMYMPCFAPNALMTKILSYFPENRKIGKPLLDGVILWNDEKSGEVLAIMDAKKITSLRTGAAGGLAARYLSAPDSKTLGVIGMGAQGVHLALFVCSARPIEEIYLYDNYIKDADAFAKHLEEMLGRKVKCNVCNDSEELLKKSDIVVTATTAKDPVLPDKAELYADKCLIGVGSFSPSMREYPAAIWEKVENVYADLEYAMEESGDLSQPLEEGLLKAENLKIISSVIGGPVLPPSKGKCNFFKTVGMSLVDMTTAEAVYKIAVEKGIGRKIED